MKKPRVETVDLLYMKEETKTKKNKRKTRSYQHKNKESKINKKQNNKTETINLENEIIIGLTPKKEEKKQVNNKKNLKKSTKKKSVNNSSEQKKNNNKKTPKKGKQKNAKKVKKTRLIKWTSIILLIIISIIILMMSSIFNIKQIVVSNNNKISSEEIISLSKLTIETNMFKTSNRVINNNVKVNPYIESVKVKRNLNGIVTLEVKERIATYMIKFSNSYAYINNQGYILEISETPLELPTITGFETSVEEIKEGNRLIVNDLKKLEDVIKIIESAKGNSLASLITSIDISQANNYKLTILSENKTVQFGDTTNINIKLLKIEEVIEQEKGISGEIYFQDLEKTVFRETVNF